MPKDSDSAVCGGCVGNVRGRDQAVECDGCKTWYHIKCGRISKAIYKGMQELKEDEELHWFCLKCLEDIRGAFRDKVIGINKRIELLEEEVNRRMNEMVRRDEMTDAKDDLRNVDSRIDDVTRDSEIEMKKRADEIKTVNEELRKIRSRLDEMAGESMKKNATVKKELEDLKKDVEKFKKDGVVDFNEVNKEVRKTFVEIMESEKEKEEQMDKSVAKERELHMKVVEMMERDKRRCNVVVMGIAEVDEETDKIEVGKVLGKLVEEVAVTFEVLGRIGKKGDKARPIRVKLRDMMDKGRILGRAKKLRNISEMSMVYVAPDLTLFQQQEDRKLREEVKRLREMGVQNVRISKGKILAGDAISD